MRVVIDTNVLISAVLSPKSTASRIFALLDQQLFELLLSESLLLEYMAALQYDRVKKRHKLSADEVIGLLQDLRSVAIFVTPTQSLSVVSDPKDNMLFECALEGGAHFIVSGDTAVRSVKQYQEIYVLSPIVFLAMWENPG